MYKAKLHVTECNSVNYNKPLTYNQQHDFSPYKSLQIHIVALTVMVAIGPLTSFAAPKMSNPAFEGLSFVDKKDIAQILIEFKRLPDEVRLSLCNGALLAYLNSQEYSGDYRVVEDAFSGVETLSKDAHFALTRVAAKMPDNDNGQCILNEKRAEKIGRANKKKGDKRSLLSLWNRFWNGGDKKVRN